MSGGLKGSVVEAKVGENVVYYYTLLPEEVIIDCGLPASLIVGVIENPEGIGEPLEEVVSRSLKVNYEFKKTLHGFCAEVLCKMPQLESQAIAQANGWVYVVDQRTADPDGEVPAQDIVGAFEVNDGKIFRYQPNPRYEINSVNGFVNFGSPINGEFESYMIDLAQKKRVSGV